MKFLLDAQLPRRLAVKLQEAGHDAVHTLNLPLGNRTPDSAINEISLSEHRVVVTKEADFVTHSLFRRSRISCCWFQRATLETMIWNRS
jgi:predicted nuclease of predicted toxin-antitoxin system